MGPSVRALAVLLLFGLSCAVESAEPEQVSTTQLAIVDGTESTPDENYAVLLNHADGNDQFSWCTGTMVAPNLVLTARHCLAEMKKEPFVCDASGNGSGGATIVSERTPRDIRVFTGVTRPTDPEATPNAVGARFITDGWPHICNHDIAFLILDHPLDTPIAAIRADPRPRAGDQFFVLGWGLARESGLNGTPPSERRRRVGNIRTVGPARDTVANIGIPDAEMAVGEATCEGDSGGPVLDPDSRAVIGVVSRGTSGGIADPTKAFESCVGATNIMSLIWSFEDLITTAFTAAGQAPKLMRTLGATCTADNECDSNICTLDGAKSYCSRPCYGQPCPAGYSCRPDNARSLFVCQEGPPPDRTLRTSGCIPEW
jgi:hypothetical protein